MLEPQRQPWAGGAGPHLQRRDLVGVRPGLIHFEFIFVYGIRKCSNFILLHVPFLSYSLAV